MRLADDGGEDDEEMAGPRAEAEEGGEKRSAEAEKVEIDVEVEAMIDVEIGGAPRTPNPWHRGRSAWRAVPKESRRREVRANGRMERMDERSFCIGI